MYRLNNTAKITYTDGQKEEVVCSYASYDRNLGFAFMDKPQPEFICIHGAQGTPILKVRKDKVARFEITDNPTIRIADEVKAPEPHNEAAVEDEFQRCINEQDEAAEAEILAEATPQAKE